MVSIVSVFYLQVFGQTRDIKRVEEHLYQSCDYTVVE